MKVALVSSWDRICGIADYAKGLWPALDEALRQQGIEGTVVSLDEYPTASALVRRIREIGPDIVHFQHEYSFYGGLSVATNVFPRLIATLHRNPGALCVATAHTVLARPDLLAGRKPGVYGALRWVAKYVLLRFFGRSWDPFTWSNLDGVIVHSRLQRDMVVAEGARVTEVIPYYMPTATAHVSTRRHATRTLLVFGFFTEFKGQDIAIRALKSLPDDVHLILAGTFQTRATQPYYEDCRALIRELGLDQRVTITGRVAAADIGSWYARADLVLAPFRFTTGSGTIAHGLAHGAAILASDEAINRELGDREPGMLEYFASGDVEDCARRIARLLADPAELERMRAAATRYAATNSVERVAQAHVRFYGRLLPRLGRHGEQ